MAKVLIKVNVAYPRSFYEKFEIQGQDRAAKGAGDFTLAVDDDKHNYNYAIVNWNSMNSARRFWASPKGMAHIVEWGSVSKPEFVFLRESPND